MKVNGEPLDRHRARAGFGLLELMVVIVILGVTATFAVPRATHQAERVRLDGAVRRLDSIWKAERRYRMLTGTWTDDLQELEDAGLLRPLSEDDPGYWTYDVPAAHGARLQMRARRVRDGGWRGEIVMDETGDLEGFVTDGEATLRP